MSSQPKPDSWFHSTVFDAESRRFRAQQRAWYRQKAKQDREHQNEHEHETVAERNIKRRERDCERQEQLHEEQDQIKRDCYFDRARGDKRKSGGDPRQALPDGTDLQALGDTFGATPERTRQAIEMRERKLSSKAKRFIFCGRIGHRVNCTASEEHKFFQPFLCKCRYCQTCGPAWFRVKFSDALFALEPVVEHLLHEGKHSQREIVVARLDFTVPNKGWMPTPQFVRDFHADLRRFWRAAEKRFGLSRKEYGVAGCDEFGGGNTNLHRHCVYVGPKLPQGKRQKLPNGTWSIPELTELWSEIRNERSFVSIKYARNFRAALAHALKYPAKFLSASTPERLAELEATFHRTRRFSAGGAFYNITPMREPGEDSPIGECPLCGARLCEVIEPWVSFFVLEGEGRRSVQQVRGEIGRARILSGASPP